MARLALGCIMLYTGDCFIILSFLVGLATAIEFFAKRSLARFFVELTPRQVALALYAQLGVVLVALIGFKYDVLSGGPGVDVHTILTGKGTFTQIFSIGALCASWSLAILGFVRMVKRLIRKIRKVVYDSGSHDAALRRHLDMADSGD